MEINETTVLDDRGFIQVSGDEAKEFLQNIVTNDVEKVSNDFTIFSSIFTPQGKYLYDFFILKAEDGYLLECEKDEFSSINSEKSTPRFEIKLIFLISRRSIFFKSIGVLFIYE